MKIKETTHKKLIKRLSKMQIETGKRVSIDDFLNNLIDIWDKRSET